MSSSSNPGYDVYLSFRGEDTRRTFVSHLRHSLAEEHILVFNDEMLERDVPLKDVLAAAIGMSKIAVVVISENYASSRWCLEELVQILDFQRKGSLTIVPVYYEVRRNDVRSHTGKFGHQSLRLHIEKSKETERWRDALTELTYFFGFISKHCVDEVVLIQKITDFICENLSGSSFCGPVGMNLHERTMFQLFAWHETDEVREIGIYGRGGIGKTTLARYFCQWFSPHFDVNVLLEDVNKIHQELQSKNIQASLNMYMISRGDIAGLTGQRVLLLADGVDTVEQIVILRKDIKRFAPGSRVIFTCRDQHLLLTCSVKHLYKVEPMAFKEAYTLFSSCAFRQDSPPKDFENLAVHAIKLADGLPSMVAAVGSELFGTSKEEWELVLSRYEQPSNEDRKEKSLFGLFGEPRRLRFKQIKLLSRQEQSLDETKKSFSDKLWHIFGKGSLGTAEKRFGLSDFSKSDESGSVEEWNTVLPKYDQSSDQGTLETEESSSCVSDDEDTFLTGKNTKLSCVGMDCHIEAVCGGMMELESDKEVPIVGVWGVGGVGKTTLARCLYEETMPHFHTHVFLENFGKVYQDHGSSHLPEAVLLEYIQKSSKNGYDLTKARLRNRKVLLIVDGVDNDEQMEDVQKVATWLGAGSRVIVTTRYENTLVANGVKHVYEVKCLKVHEALQLFYQIAFKQETPSTLFKQLSVRAVQLSGRIPLALEVLASLLRGKSENEWESVLQKLEGQHGKDVMRMKQTLIEDSEEESDDDRDRIDISIFSWKFVWRSLKYLLFGG